ncbi:MAG: hypothetical protein AB8B62_05935 [Roseobacter sp.]
MLIVYAAVSGGAVIASETSALAKYGAWSVFVETDPRPKTCWIATLLHYDDANDQNYLLAVAQFGGATRQEVSIFSNKRMQRSVGLFINLRGRDYRMVSDGTNAWVREGNDRRVLKLLLEAAGGKNEAVLAGSKGFGSVKVDMSGFPQALDRMRSECS